MITKSKDSSKSLDTSSCKMSRSNEGGQLAICTSEEETKKSVMRLSVMYVHERVILDISASEKVSDVRERVRDVFGIGSDEGPTGGEMQERKILTLTYCGADLDHKWYITDVGIPSGSSIRAVLRDEIKPTVYIYSVFNEETVPVIQKINFRTMTAGEFRGIASRKTGLPVGVFRLLNHNGKEMFDCHSLDEYELDLGGTLILEIWDGWTAFLNLAMMGFSSHVMDSLSHDEIISRYQMKVAMYIAAHFGHVDLAVSLLRMGVRADESIGTHPTRQWCKTSEQHIDTYKTPIHEAAETGQLGVLRSFVHHNVCTVMAKDGNELNPLNIALRKKQKACASFLLTKQWSKMNYTKKHSVPLSIYVKMKRWGDRGRDKAFVLHGHWKSSVKNPRRFTQGGALVGQGVQLDGFSSSKMASKTANDLRQEQDNETCKVKPLWDFTDDFKEPGALDPASYFKSLSQMHSVKLPRLAKWGKAMNKASYQATEHKQDSNLSDAESRKDNASETGSRSRQHLRSESIEGDVNKLLKLPPIHEQNGKALSSSQQNLANALNNDLEKKGKAGRPGIIIQTGSNASPPSPTKGSQSTQSIPETVATVKDIPLKLAEIESEVLTRRRPNKRRHPLQMIHKAKAGDSTMPLPMISVDSSPRPFVPDPRLMHRTLDLFKKHRGMDSRNYAIRCLSVANSFKDKPWLSQVQQAMTIATRGVRRVIEKQPHLFSSRLDKSNAGTPANGSRMGARLSSSLASA